MWTIVTKPLEAISEAKKENNMGKTLLVLLVAVILFGVSMFFFARSASSNMFWYAIMTAVVLYIMTLILGVVLQVILNVFTGKNEYFKALTPIVYSELIVSFGLLVSSILGLIPTFVGPLLAFLMMLWALASSQALLFKGTMEMYETDVITVLVSLGILYVAVAFAAYIALAGRLLTLLGSYMPALKAI